MKKQRVIVILALANLFQTAFFGLAGATYVEMQSDRINVVILILLVTVASATLTATSILLYFAYRKTLKKR